VIDQPAHPRPITSLVTHGYFVATGASDATVKLWRFTIDGENKGSYIRRSCLTCSNYYYFDIRLSGPCSKLGPKWKISIRYAADSFSGNILWAIIRLPPTNTHLAPQGLILAVASTGREIKIYTGTESQVRAKVLPPHTS
jgi:hypothetical protein